MFRKKISRLLYESDILTQAGAPYHADFRNLRLGKVLQITHKSY